MAPYPLIASSAPSRRNRGEPPDASPAPETLFLRGSYEPRERRAQTLIPLTYLTLPGGNTIPLPYPIFINLLYRHAAARFNTNRPAISCVSSKTYAAIFTLCEHGEDGRRTRGQKEDKNRHP